jgi:hypothetical protein
MKVTLKPARQPRQGYAYLITLMFLTIIILTLADLWRWTENSAKLSQRNITFNQSTEAAEAATEKVFTLMDRDFLYGAFNTNSSYYATNIPDTSSTNVWPIQYTFSDGQGNNNQIYVGMAQKAILEPLNAQYSGLNGYSIDCTNIAVATPRNLLYNVPATVQQTFQAAIIPVFQFAIFYNLNLEIDPGSPMTIGGPVYCNQNIWEGSPNTTYKSTVSAVGTNYYTGGSSVADPFCSGKSDSGNSTFLIAGQPTDANNALVLPIGGSTDSNPTNVEAILNLPPASLSVPADIAYLDTNQIYLYNESDLIVSNTSTGLASSSPTGTCGITIFFDDKEQANRMRQLTNDYYTLKTGGSTNYVNYSVSAQGTAKKDSYTNVLYAGWSFATNVSFYDYRESKKVQAVQIDVAQFNIWVTNKVATNGGYQYNVLCGGTDGSTGDKYHPIGSIYVINKVPFNGSQLPGVRLINGQVMPSSYGLTVSTPQPAYVYGHYNVRTNLTKGGTDVGLNVTTNSWPAAIMADSVTILSTNWFDTYASSLAVSSRTPVATTINAAMLEGIVQSKGSAYSGGVENFLRLLENWSTSIPLTYNGSIVVMFPSVYATNAWNGNYYGVPKRQWAFDLNFTNATGLPPLSPSSRSLIRGNWSAY